MKICHISDTHTFHWEFKNERFNGVDIVVHSGDATNSKNPIFNKKEMEDFINWYSLLNVKHKILIAGNHDTSIEKNKITKEFIESKGIIYLHNSDVIIDGVKFWGSPYTPTFGDGWAFNKQRAKINLVWQQIPDDTDVLIVHGPPKGVRDLSYDRNNNLEMCGCSALMKRCMILKNNLKYVLFGHIHNSEDIINQGISTYSVTKTIFSNATCVDDGRFDKGLTSYGNIINLT
jgi:predicted phosphodiesterase